MSAEEAQRVALLGGEFLLLGQLIVPKQAEIIAAIL